MRLNMRIGSALLFAVVLLGAALFLRPQTGATTQNAGVVVVATQPRNYQETRDSDGDGIRDWEEELWGTNPELKDVSSTTRAEVLKKDTENEEVPNTVTSHFAQRFFGEYIQANSDDIPMTDEEKQRFLEKSLVEVATLGYQQPFTLRDIRTTATSSPEALREYGNSVMLAIVRDPVESEGELAIYKLAIESGNDDLLKKLDPIIASYDRTIKDLRALEVPQVLGSEHVGLLNSMRDIHTTITALRNTPQDPLPALVRFKQYVPQVEELQRSLNAVHTSLTAKGITYTDAEPGSLFEKFQ